MTRETDTRERIRRSWDATSESYCDLGPTFLLCEETGERAVNGACPVHGGDACMFVYGKVLLLDANRNPALAAAFRRSNREAAAERARVLAARVAAWLDDPPHEVANALNALERDAAALHREQQAIHALADLYDAMTGRVGTAQVGRNIRALAASSAADGARTTEDDHASFQQGRRASSGLTWHDEFARCPECGNATVGLTPPYGINHAAGCAAALTLSSAADGAEREPCDYCKTMGREWTPDCEETKAHLAADGAET